MSQDLLTYTDDELKKLLLKMSGGMAPPAPVKPAPVATAPKAAPAPAITSGQPDLLKSLLQKRIQGQATVAPSGTLPPLTPSAPISGSATTKIPPLQDTIAPYRTEQRGIFGGAEAFGPAAAEVMNLGPTRKTVADMVSEGGEPGIPGIDTARGPGKILESIAGGIKPIEKMFTGKGNAIVGAVEGIDQVGTGILGFIAGTIGSFGKLGYDTILGKGDMAAAQAFGDKISEALTYKPKTEKGQAVAEVLGSPFVFFDLIREPGRILWPNDPQAQASWNMATNLAMIMTGAAKKHAMPRWDLKGKVYYAPLKPLDAKAAKQYQEWYKERAKDPTPPTVAEVRQVAQSLKIDEPLIDASEKMIRNMEEQGGGPEGPAAPYQPPSPGTVIKTADGTTITVAPPKAPVAPSVLAARQRSTPQIIPTAEGSLGARPATRTTGPVSMDVYHGTAKFDGFNKPLVRSGGDADLGLGGAFFTDNKSYAEAAIDFGDRGGEPGARNRGGVVVKARVTLKKPFVLKSKGGEQSWFSLFEESAPEFIRNGEINFAEIRKTLESRGYDGIIAEGMGEGGPPQTWVVPFDAKKSAKVIETYTWRTEYAPDSNVGKQIRSVPEPPPSGVAPAVEKRDLRTRPTQAAWDKRDYSAMDDAGLKSIEANIVRRFDPEEVASAAAELDRRMEAKIATEKAAPAVPTGTFSREEAYAILKTIDESHPQALNSLAQSFGVDPTGKTPREIMAEVGPEIMKIEKRKGAIEDVARRTREDTAGEPIGMNEEYGGEAEPTPAKPTPTTPKPAPARAATPRTAAPPAEAKPLGREALKAIAEEQAGIFDKFRPEPTDPAARARWLEDKKNFVSRATVAKAKKAGGGNVGFFGSGAIQDMYERFKGGTKDADKVAWLMERWNEHVGTIKKGGEAGWPAYYLADAIEQLGPLYRTIAEQYHKMTGGQGFYESVIKYKTEEGQKNADRIRELRTELDDIDVRYDRATGSLQEETITKKKEVPYQLGKDYKEAGMPVELGRFSAFVDESAKVAASPTMPEGARAEVARILGEKDAVLQELNGLEKQAFEHELTLEPVVTEFKRPEPYTSVENPVAKDLSWKPTKAEQKILDSHYTREDWLARSAAEMKKKEQNKSEAAIITPERIGHQEIYSAMTLLEENIRKARARKRSVPPREMVGIPSDHPVYKPLHDALAAGDMAKADSIIKNAKNRLMDYAVEEGGPYRESPAIPEVKRELTTVEPVNQVPPGVKGNVRDSLGHRVRMFEPPREEGGPVQFYPQKAESVARDQQQWRKSMKDITKENGPGLPGHFSNTDQFPRLYPEAPKDAYPKVIDRANRINDLAIEAVDKVLEEGIRSRLTKERIFLESEASGLTKADRALSPYGATIEDVLRAKKADAWVKTFKWLKKIGKLGELDQINNVVKEHMDSGLTAAERSEAIARDIRHLPVAKMLFKYSERAAKNALGETVKTAPGAPLTEWQMNQALFDAFEKSKGDDFMQRFATELEGAGKSEFGPQGSAPNELGHLALRVFAEQFWDEKRISDYTGGNVVKKRGVELLVREGVSAPVAQHVLINEFGASNVPTKAENVGAWGKGYQEYLKEHMEDWAPEAIAKYKRLSGNITDKQRLTGGPIESRGGILDTYFGPIIRELDRRAGRTPIKEKVRRAVSEKGVEKAAGKTAEEARLREEAAAQNKKIAEKPEDYNVIEVSDTEAPGFEETGGEKPHFPWDEGGGGGEAGFLGTPWMFNKLTKPIADVMKKWVADLKETRAERAQRMDRESRTHQFADPAAQAAWEAGHRASRVDTAGQALNKRIREVRDSLTRVYKTLPNKPEFAFAIDRLKWMEKEYARSTNEANQIVNGYVLKPIDDIASPHTKRRLEDTFAKKVFMDDMQEMYDGGATEFPQRLTRASVPLEVKKLNDFIDALPVDEKKVILSVVDASRAKMKEITDQIVAEGDIAGYNFRDIFNRKNYYRHELLAYYDKQVRGGKKMKPSTYSWGQKRRTEGYAGDIVTDVRLVNTEILTRLVYERDRLRIHNAMDKQYNIYDRVEAEALSKGMSMKEAYDKLIPKGYGVYFFDQNHLIFNALTLSERLAQKILAGKLGEINPADVKTIRERMAIGPKRKPWIIPEELAATLDDFAKPRPEPSWYAQVPVEITSMWKGWKLLGPKRILKFQFRNLTGDAEMHAIGNPSTFTKVKASVKMLDDYYRKGIASPEMLEWIDKGGMDTTFHWAEVGDFQRLWKFSESMADRPMAATIGPEMFKKGWNTYFDWAKRSSDLREGTLRLAAYLDYREQLVKNNMAGRGEVPNNYGASQRGMINALPDIPTKAFWLSNELSGAYDMVSPMGKAARQGIIPFWSWKELTTKRYYRMMKNASIDGKTARQVGRQFAPAAPYAALQVGKFILKANAAMAILQAINHVAPGIVGDPDAEEKLPVDVQSKPHITFGKGHYFSQVGSASDLLDFFGLDIPSEMVVRFVRDINAGRVPDIEDIAKTWWKDQPMVNQIFQSITPLIKVPADLLYGRKMYPNISKPRGIRDPWEYVADQLDIGPEYRIAVDRPGKDTIPQVVAKLFDYQHEENETAYFDWLGVVNDFRKARGTNTIGYSITPSSNYLYYFKRANAEGDKESAQKYFKKYVVATYLQGGLKGKDPKQITDGILAGVQQSYKNMFPLYGLSPVEVADLSKTLRPEQKRMLARATKYWAEIIVGKEDAPGVTADIEKERSELEF